MKRILLLIFTLITIAYPFVLYFSLDKISIQLISFIIAPILIARFFLLRVRYFYDGVIAALGILICLLSYYFNSNMPLRWYPLIINFAMLSVFYSSLYASQTIIERFARLSFDKNQTFPSHAIIYTRNVTKVWCVFFVLNGLISAWTIFHDDLKIWTVYNGFIAYILMGFLFVVEWFYRKIYRTRHEQTI
ncbi:putative membrane protein [Hydromonas duriensis]|uniref:Putative membrane protein n=1 Tax=Hydromonas duriensis TaxID=1527608 RepID=A0A4R6Y5M5_9BURK|nr:putative membrane protein [Hydromonas duriensis]